MAVGIVLVYLVMVASLGSLRNPVVIVTTLPFALIGALAALVITGRSLGLPAMMGILLLIGIVVTNAIVLIAFVEQLREKGMSVYDALINGGRVRLITPDSDDRPDDELRAAASGGCAVRRRRHHQRRAGYGGDRRADELDGAYAHRGAGGVQHFQREHSADVPAGRQQSESQAGALRRDAMGFTAEGAEIAELASL